MKGKNPLEIENRMALEGPWIDLAKNMRPEDIAGQNWPIDRLTSPGQAVG